MKHKTLQQRANEQGVTRQAVWEKTKKGKAYLKIYYQTSKYKAYQRAYKKTYRQIPKQKAYQRIYQKAYYKRMKLK